MRTHSRILSVFAVAAMLSGCIFTTGPSGSSGDISFTWTFNGRSCIQTPDVTQVTIQIPGQTLANGGVYGCVNGGTAGIKLLNFSPGTYTYTITAQNSQGAAAFQSTGRVIVNGDVAEVVDLKPTANATGTAFVAWTLPPTSNVTCQYLASIDITIDNETMPHANNCAAGLYNSSVTTLQGPSISLAPGAHTILIDARDASGLYYYRKQGTFQVNVAETTQQVFTLDWLVGTVPLRWGFSNGASLLTCAQAGISQVQVTFRDSNGDLTQTVPCSLSGIDGYTPYLYTGSFQVFASAVGGGFTYASSTATPPVVTAQAGVFPALTNSVQPLMVLQ